MRPAPAGQKQIRHAVEANVTLDHATIGNRPERWRERQSLLGQIQLENVVVGPVSRTGQRGGRNSKVLWSKNCIEAVASEYSFEARDCSQLRRGLRDPRGRRGRRERRGRCDASLGSEASGRGYLPPSETARPLEGGLSRNSIRHDSIHILFLVSNAGQTVHGAPPASISGNLTGGHGRGRLAE